MITFLLGVSFILIQTSLVHCNNIKYIASDGIDINDTQCSDDNNPCQTWDYVANFFENGNNTVILEANTTSVISNPIIGNTNTSDRYSIKGRNSETNILSLAHSNSFTNTPLFSSIASLHLLDISIIFDANLTDATLVHLGLSGNSNSDSMVLNFVQILNPNYATTDAFITTNDTRKSNIIYFAISNIGKVDGIVSILNSDEATISYFAIETSNAKSNIFSIDSVEIVML